MIQFNSESALNERQAAKFLGISPGTLRLWRSEGRAPRYFRAGKLVRYRRTDIDIWIMDRLTDVPAAKEVR